MPMEEDPDKINDADRQIAARVYNEAEAYADTRRVSRDLNDKRTKSRKKIEEMGFRKDAYQTAIRVIKDLLPREQKDFMRDLSTFLKILGGRQADLFPEEALKAAKREEKRKAAAAENKPKTRAQADAKSDKNPKSDPKRGGAGKAVPETFSTSTADGDALIKEVAAKKATEAAGAGSDANAAEQAEGDAVLAAGLPETRKSQSQQAAEKLEAAKLN